MLHHKVNPVKTVSMFENAKSGDIAFAFFTTALTYDEGTSLKFKTALNASREITLCTASIAMEHKFNRRTFFILVIFAI